MSKTKDPIELNDISAEVLRQMARECPFGQEVILIAGIARMGFSGKYTAYREAVLKGFRERNMVKQKPEEVSNVE